LIHIFVYLLIGLALGVGLSFIFFRPKLRHLEHLSKTDDLTGIGNYRDLNSFLQSFQQNPNLQATTFTIVLIDLDNFKSINDKEGYQKGDKVLKDFAAFLKFNIRKEDFVFRYKQGDEFALIINTKEAMVDEIIKRLQASKPADLPEFSYAFATLKKDTLNKCISKVEEKLRVSKASKRL
jgi:diguanylate cyclase (GGDEF)-like protein